MDKPGAAIVANNVIKVAFMAASPMCLKVLCRNQYLEQIQLSSKPKGVEAMYVISQLSDGTIFEDGM